MKTGNDVVVRRRYDFIECGCCGYYHRLEWYGDCRDDDNRFSIDDIPNDAIVLDWDTQMEMEE